MLLEDRTVLCAVSLLAAAPPRHAHACGMKFDLFACVRVVLGHPISGVTVDALAFEILGGDVLIAHAASLQGFNGRPVWQSRRSSLSLA